MALPIVTPSPPPPQPPARVSRRALLAGGLGAAALAAIGVPAALYLNRGHAPRRTGALVSQLLATKPFYIAHGGGSRDWPEMSLQAYRQAVAVGVDALEVSLARSSDGVWFGLHDPTLDRTSGTRGFVAAQHPWAEIGQYRISAAATSDPSQPAQPYLRFDQLIDEFAGTHTIFVDPKAADERYYPELLSLMTSVPHPAESFIAKYYCTGTEWARAARAQGLRSWGYYYGAEIDSGRTPLADTQADWDLLGLDVAASAAAWRTIRSYGKPVIGHVIADRKSAHRALGDGAAGLMVSDLLRVLGS